MRFWWAGGCWVLALVVTLGADAGGGDKKFKGGVDAFFKKLDSNKDGKLSKVEFLKLADRAKDKEKAKQALSEAYDKLDPEKKGVTKEQLKRYLENGKNGDPDGAK